MIQKLRTFLVGVVILIMISTSTSLQEQSELQDIKEKQKKLVGSFHGYQDAVEGCLYPEAIYYSFNSTNASEITFLWTNQSANIPPSFNYTLKTTFIPTKCQFALETLDYGIYQKFPFYRIIALCHNSTVQGAFIVERYRSGDTLTKYPTTLKPFNQNNESYGKLTVSYSYGVGTYSSLVYRLVKNATSGQIVYWEKYTKSTQPQIISVEQIATHLKYDVNQLSLTDILFNVGTFTVYTSEKLGLIISSQINKVVYRTIFPVSTRPLAVVKLCWSQIICIITGNSNNEYSFQFIQISGLENPTITKVAEKTQKMGYGLKYFGSSGKSVFMCSQTDLYIISLIYDPFRQENTVQTMQKTNFIKSATIIPYFQQDLCVHGYFYYNGVKISFPQVPSPLDYVGGIETWQIIQPFPDYKIIQYVQISPQWLISAISDDEGSITGIYDCRRGIKCMKITVLPGGTNQLNMHLSPYPTTPNAKIVHILFRTNNNKTGYLQVNIIDNRWQISLDFPYIFDARVQLPVHLQSCDILANGGFDTLYLAKTQIQQNSFTHFHIKRASDSRIFSFQFYYPFQFESNNYQVCPQTINSLMPNSYMMYRVDKKEQKIDIMMVGIRNKNAYVIEDTFTIPAVGDVHIKCWWDGVLIFNDQKVKFYNQYFGQVSSMQGQQVNNILASKTLYAQQKSDGTIEVFSTNFKLLATLSGTLLKSASPTISYFEDGSGFIYKPLSGQHPIYVKNSSTRRKYLTNQ